MDNFFTCETPTYLTTNTLLSAGYSFHVTDLTVPLVPGLHGVHHYNPPVTYVTWYHHYEFTSRCTR